MVVLLSNVLVTRLLDYENGSPEFKSRETIKSREVNTAALK